MDVRYLKNVPDAFLQSGIEQFERWIKTEPNDTSALMKNAKTRLAEYKAEVANRAVLAQADSAKPEGEVSDAVALARAQIARLRSALETIRDYPVVEVDMDLGHQVAGMAMQAEVALEEYPPESGLLTILANKLTTAQAELASAKAENGRLRAALEVVFDHLDRIPAASLMSQHDVDNAYNALGDALQAGTEGR